MLVAAELAAAESLETQPCGLPDSPAVDRVLHGEAGLILTLAARTMSIQSFSTNVPTKPPRMPIRNAGLSYFDPVLRSLGGPGEHRCLEEIAVPVAGLLACRYTSRYVSRPVCG
jgi:hypothetical protein